MPNNQVKSKTWFIRITAPWEHIQSKTTTIQGWIDYDGAMLGLHHGDKGGAPHAHIVLRLKGELQKQSVDARFKKLYDVSGARYSSKQWDGNLKAISYLYHDKEGSVFNYMGFTEEALQEVKDLNTEIQKVVAVNKGKASNKVVEYAMAHCTSGWTRREIAHYILTAVANGEFYDPGDFALEKYLNEIELKLASGNKVDLERVIDARLSRLSSFRN